MLSRPHSGARRARACATVGGTAMAPRPPSRARRVPAAFPGHPLGSPGDSCSLLPAPGAAPSLSLQGLVRALQQLQEVRVNTAIKKKKKKVVPGAVLRLKMALW